MQFVEVLDVLMLLKKDKVVKVSIVVFYHFQNYFWKELLSWVELLIKIFFIVKKKEE